ncbi:MAG: hypothetical protein UW40_C0010G0019 [Parcubacteria group bacterium GW2011_GWF2_44_17]|nr:MAG: hypothetical protein UW40_C0010G0019 [Parcubacteria group bacterium GW2011_GWF2_44_17]
MCGIAGIYNTNGESVSRDHILGMTDILLHRGPEMGLGLVIVALLYLILRMPESNR